MNTARIDKIAEAILYEGYVLYPYRPSAMKNRQRWTFGGLSPRPYSEAQGGAERWFSQTECLAVGTENAVVSVRVRFLHLTARQAAEPAHTIGESECNAASFRPVAALKIGNKLFQTWQEAVEREFTTPQIALRCLSGQPRRINRSFPASDSIEMLRDAAGNLAGAFIRKQNALDAAVDLSVEGIGDSVFRLRVQLLNLTSLPSADHISRDEAMMYSLASSHLVLAVDNGEFASLLDPPSQFQGAAAECKNIGCYPVLVGEEGERTAMLSSPVILYDYPRIAPQSPGNLFDGTEIDEILLLRIMTLTDDEKSEVRGSDERTRALLERVESHPEHLANLHGTIRSIATAQEENS